MGIKINSLEIRDLYGVRNFFVKFDDNQLILVGENGSGKSTLASILYYVLTCQWHKLLQYEFSSITLTINNAPHFISKDDVSAFSETEYPSDDAHYVAHRLNFLGIEAERALVDFSPPIHRMLTEDIRVGPPALRRILKDLVENQEGLFSDVPDGLKKIQRLLNLHVLFLPTYRRIERDLKTIFPAVEEELGRFNRKMNRISDYRKHTELVEFGMQDVKTMISDTMKWLDMQFRASLDALTGGYLRVILRKEYEQIDTSMLKEIDESYLEEILQKIDESILSDQDQKALRETIKQFGDIGPESEIDKLSAHIITQLILLHKEQYEREDRVRAFASVCNRYLKGKRFEFNSNDFTLPIYLVFDDESNEEKSPKRELMLSMLSSGEKQIVSLFSHLYLSDIDDYFIIIDEPELSLSVTWQKTFLPDMLASNKCKGLVAVTHSPFIYSNDLETKAHSIEEFVTEDTRLL